MSLSAWLSKKQQGVSRPSDASQLVYSDRPDDSKSVYSNSGRSNYTDWDYSLPSRVSTKDLSDTRSVKTTFTTTTALGKPHRMQWRSASGQNSAEMAIRENSFNEQEDAFDDQDEGDDGGDDVLVESTDNSISSRASAFLPHRSTNSMGLEPIQIFVVDTDAEQAAKTRKLGSDLRFKEYQQYENYENECKPEASLSETMSAYLDSSFSHGLSSRSQSPYKNKPELTQYVRPSAFEIAREGWLFHHLTTENDNDHNWEKSFTIATYQQISKTGILQLYESDSDIHPFRVLDLTQLDSILPTLRPTIAYLNPMADPLTLYSFTLVIGSKNVVLYCVSLAERDAWISALQIMQNRAPHSKKIIPQTHSSSTLNEVTNSDILETKESTTTILPSTSETAVPSESILSEIKSLISTKTDLIMESIWSAHSTSTRTTEAQEEKVAEGGGTLADVESTLLELTESMEMRTSRIGKMVHDLVGGQKGIAEDVKLLLSRSSGEGTVQSGIQSSSIEGLEEGQKAISCDIGSLLAIAAEGNMSQRVGWESMDEKISEMSRQIQAMNMRDVEQRILDAVNKTIAEIPQSSNSNRGTSENEELLHGKLDNIAEVIDFVNKSQCRLVSLITDNCKLSPSPSPSRSGHHSSKDLNYARIIESIQDTISELLEPFLQQQQQLREHQLSSQNQTSSIDNPSSSTSTKALTNHLLESLATLDDHLTRTARESASRQDLLEVWMQRNQESLKQIQQTVSSVEKIERSLSPVKQYPNNNNASTLSPTNSFIKEDEKRMHGFMKELERRAAGVVEDLVVDLKESWSGRQKRIGEDMESLLEEKAKLLVDVSGLRNVKRELEEDVCRLRVMKEEFECVRPLGDAVVELEKDLLERVDGLVRQIDGLKRERDKLINTEN